MKHTWEEQFDELKPQLKAVLGGEDTAEIGNQLLDMLWESSWKNQVKQFIKENFVSKEEVNDLEAYVDRMWAEEHADEKADELLKEVLEQIEKLTTQ